jgi:two-component system, OmpR family, phosphate regulon sensor histidine kinase PhoR
MSAFWRRELTKFAVFLLIALFINAIEGAEPALFFLCIALLLGNLYHLRNLAALTKWLPKADGSPVPQGRGSWEEPFATLYRMVRGTQKSRNQLTEALDRFQSAAAAMPDGVLLLDEAGRIEWGNPSAERHFGLNLKQDRGSQVTYLIRQPEFASYLSAQIYREPLLLRGVRNTDLILSVQLVPYGDDRRLVLSRDITQLEKAENARRDLVANVSHELRTPLTVVGGFVETLSDMAHADPALIKRSLTLMREQTTRMQRLVEDLLTLARLESEPPATDETRLVIPELMAALQQEGEQLSQGKHRFKIELESDLALLGSRGEIHSALSNLVSNAVRYTPASGEIRLSWRADVQRGGVFSVHDTGPGIAREHIPRLTERFYRVDRSRSRETGGTGLGLAIVKHALNRHQARLEIQSELGKGSVFSAVFPARRLLAPEKKRALVLQ